MLMRATSDRRVFTGLLAGLVLLAWLALWLWGQSPYGRFLSHQNLEGLSWDGVALLIVFVGGWTLMTIAMMLPTSLPLITLFFAFNRRKKSRFILVYLLLMGYLSLWTLFGLVIHLGDWLLHEAVRQSPWLHEHVWLVSALVLLSGGIYQFSPLKYHCLEKCRSPLSFIAEHWRGKDERKQAFSLGLHHGLFCIGCCWSLMLLMFAVGMGNFGFMLVLGSLMAIEKNLPWGRFLSPLVGLSLLGGGLLVVVTSLAVYF